MQMALPNIWNDHTKFVKLYSIYYFIWFLFDNKHLLGSIKETFLLGLISLVIY